jgi:hypothetical protein
MCLVGALSRRVIEWFTNSLIVRGWVHDSSMLEEPEKAAFDASGDEGCGSKGPAAKEAKQEFLSPGSTSANRGLAGY